MTAVYRPPTATLDTLSQERLLFVRLVLVAVFLLLFAVLFRLQVFEGSYYRALAEGNRVRRLPVPAPRGIIFDRNGVPLVSNLPSYRLIDCQEESVCRPRQISKDQAIELTTKGLTKGSRLEVDTSRVYSYKDVTAHVLGYLSLVTRQDLKTKPSYLFGDRVGRDGIEAQYESFLRGDNGEELVEVDALARKLRTLARQEPRSGRDLELTIDINLQKVAAEELRDKKGAIIVSQPDSGEILALVSSPSFDPNIFTDFSLDSDYRQTVVNQLLNNKDYPLFNRAISGVYPPGSTFKIVSAVAGLEEGKIREDFVIDDPGIIVIGPYRFPNWKYLKDGGLQGLLNVVSAIKVSNDIFFYRLGEALGVDLLTDWATRFGLGRELGVDLPSQAAGTIPTPLWRGENKPDWYLGDTYHLAIGQGDLLVTPLQVNTWTSVLASGGRLCRPHLLGHVGEPEDLLCPSVSISPRTLALVKEGMVAACSPGGTGWPLFEFKVRSQKLPVACKTGTAEFADPNGRTHAWLTAFVAPDKTAAQSGPGPVVVTVLVEGGGEGSDVAAPIAKRLLQTWFEK